MEKTGSAFSLRLRRLSLALLILGGVGCDQAGTPKAKPAPVVDFNATKAHAEQGEAQAQNDLGELYAHGQGVPQDYAQAAKWYRLAADQGLPQGQCNLAALLAAGAGVKSDAAEAVKWYRKAAEKNSVDAQYNLGQMLSMGIGAKRDLPEAIRFYQLAAEQGDELSQYNLARRYREGKDVPVDPVQAYFWFTLAATKGVEEALPMRALLQKDMTSAQIAEAQKRVKNFKPAAPKTPEK